LKKCRRVGSIDASYGMLVKGVMPDLAM